MRGSVRSATVTTMGGVLVLLAAGPAFASYHGGTGQPPAEDATEVAAAGNPFTGGLAFDPAEVGVGVGDTVRWTNTDFLVPHTATEDNGLWDLSGEYGLPSEGFRGFAPGESRERRFEAGSFSYFCRVHPVEMRGTVAVPVELRARRVRRGVPRRSGPRVDVIARWSETALPEGQVFDVQRRMRGRWRFVRRMRGTERTVIRFRRVRAGRLFAIRARVRRTDQPGAASGWSPPARLRTGRQPGQAEGG